jgi:hypothetical protein
MSFKEIKKCLYYLNLSINPKKIEELKLEPKMIEKIVFKAFNEEIQHEWMKVMY